MKLYNIRLNLEWNPEPHNTYTVTSPDVPEIITLGRDMAEILRNVQDALETWIEYLQAEGEEIPAILQPVELTQITLPVPA